MLSRWLVRVLWRPFEAFCHWNPLIPIGLRREEVAPGVEAVFMRNAPVRFLTFVSGGYDYAVFYIVDGELFFDSGYAWAAKTLRRHLADSGLEETVRYVVSSHAHEDHCGNNALLLERCPGAEVYAHPRAHPQMLFPTALPWYRRFLFGPLGASPASPLPEAFELGSGRRLRVIETPGHTPGHICLYDPAEKILFAGDLFLDERVDSQLAEVDGPLWIESLGRALELDITLLLDGHGVVVRGADVRARLEGKLRFLCCLRAKVHALVAEGPRQLDELARAVFTDPSLVNLISQNQGWMSVITGGDFSRSNLVRGFVDEALLGAVAVACGAPADPVSQDADVAAARP